MFKIILSLALKMALGKLAKFGLQTVNNLQNRDLTGSKKREEAFKLIKEEAKVAGKDLRDSLINLAIEVGVNLLKERMDK